MVCYPLSLIANIPEKGATPVPFSTLHTVMVITCKEDSVEVASVCCACTFPLTPLCPSHAQKHSEIGSGLHFLLPLSALESIRTESDYADCQDRCFRIDRNINLFQKRVQVFDDFAEQIEATYREAVHLAGQTRDRLAQGCEAAMQVDVSGKGV